MVRAGLGVRWHCLFANDIDPLKARVYADNWGSDEILREDIHNVGPKDLPGRADLAWASFPCQDLSVAGNGLGIGAAAKTERTRSGTFWGFVDVMRALQSEGRMPRIVVLENVLGLLTINGGTEFQAVIGALTKLDFRVGAVVIDASHFLPQSRPRVFIVAVSAHSTLSDDIVRQKPHAVWHPDVLIKAVNKLPLRLRENWVWFSLGAPPMRKRTLASVVSDSAVGADWHTPTETRRLVGMMSDAHKEKLNSVKKSGKRVVGTLSLRMRPFEGKTVQRAEICFRGLAGCLRTPRGGGSRPRVIIVKGNDVKTRLLTSKEALVLMGLKPDYCLPAGYDNSFRVIGDGVVVPVVAFLRSRLLAPLFRSTTLRHKSQRTSRRLKPSHEEIRA